MKKWKVNVELEFFINTSDDEDEAREFALSCLDIDIDDDAEMEKVKNIELVEYENNFIEE